MGHEEGTAGRPGPGLNWSWFRVWQLLAVEAALTLGVLVALKAAGWLP